MKEIIKSQTLRPHGRKLKVALNKANCNKRGEKKKTVILAGTARHESVYRPQQENKDWLALAGSGISYIKAGNLATLTE